MKRLFAASPVGSAAFQPSTRTAVPRSKYSAAAVAAVLAIALAVGMGIPTLAFADTAKNTTDAAPKKAEQKVIVIDAGHQKTGMSSTEPIGPGAKQRKMKVTWGTTGCVTHVPEYKLTLQVAKRLQKELVKRGYRVIMVRTTHNVRISNAQRAKIANRAKADAFIRIHANSSSSSSVKGALTIAPTSKNKYMSKKNRNRSYTLSKQVLKHMCKATGAKNRGVWRTDTMSGINWCKVPVTIVEMGFMSNPAEDRKMQKASYQKKIVKGIANGLDAYFKK